MRAAQQAYFSAARRAPAESAKRFLQEAKQLEQLVDARLASERGEGDLADLVQAFCRWVVDQRSEIDAGERGVFGVYVLDGQRVDSLVKLLLERLKGFEGE